MTIDRTREYLQSLLRELVKLSQETEWAEFKHNNANPQMIGEYISALANAAALMGKQSAYMVWGVDDDRHEVIGTDFCPSQVRHKQQELESWLLQKLVPKIHFRFFEFVVADETPVVILEIQAASHTPVQFDGIEYIRVGSYKKKLRAFQEKERALWRVFDAVPFEQQWAVENIDAGDVLKQLDYPAYFDSLDVPLPENRDGILSALESDKMIQRSDAGRWHISNLGAVLFAKNLQQFAALARKSVRLILYKGDNRFETIREIEGNKGYAIGFEGLVENLKTLLPSYEEIGSAFRKEVTMYPELAVRELLANAIIHQDFSLHGTGVMVEIFVTRLEITNPGVPLMDTQRFLDTPPQSRNEALASFMRRIHICEERGTGVDKVVLQTELHQLPAPLFEKTERHTRATLFTHKALKDMDAEEKVRACYLHCCLKYVNREPMNNASVRERFAIEEQNKSQASHIIKATIQSGFIRAYDPTVGVRSLHYVPCWS